MRPRFPRHFDLADVESYLENHRTHEWVPVGSVWQLQLRRPDAPSSVLCHHLDRFTESQDQPVTHECARCGWTASEEASTWGGVPDCESALGRAVLET